MSRFIGALNLSSESDMRFGRSGPNFRPMVRLLL